MSDYRFVLGSEYNRLPRVAQPWIIEPLLSPGALLNIYGQPKAGKSRAALGLAMAVANGEPYWFKFPVRTHGPVLWLEVDNSPAEWAEVTQTVEYGAGCDLSRVGFADRELAPYPFDLLDQEAAHDQLLKGMIERFREEWATDPVMIVIDTIREVHSGEEDSSTIMRNVITKLQAVTYPAALVLISHSRKGGGLQALQQHGGTDDADHEGDIMKEGRGSNYLAGKMQSVVRITTNRERTHGYFTAEGRSIGHERFRIVQKAPAYLWFEDLDPAVEMAQQMLATNPEASERAHAKVLMQAFPDRFDNIDAARGVIRRVKAKVAS